MVPRWDTVEMLYVVESPPFDSVILSCVSDQGAMVILIMITKINSLLFS